MCGAQGAARRLVAESGGYHHCTRCDLVYQSRGELPEPHAERMHYGLHENRVDDPAYRAFLAQLADPLIERLEPGDHGLDFGCGPGPALAAMLIEAGFPTAVYDPYFAPDVGVLAPAYDFVTATEVIEHLHRPVREFDMFGNLLKPGGWLGLMTEVRPPLDEFEGWWYHKDPTHVAFYSEATLDWIGERYGWELVACGPRVILYRA